MKIILTDSVAENCSYDIKESFQFSDIGADCTADLRAHIQLCQLSQYLYSLTGRLKATVLTSCGRCGTEVEVIIEQGFRYQLRLGNEPIMASEYDCTEEDSEFLYLADPVIETSDILSEQLFLALPVYHLCDETCKGLCEHCGVDLNKKQCKCGEINKESPFTVLKDLQKK